jgi:hypothetical protein
MAGLTFHGSLSQEVELVSTAQYSGRGWNSVRELEFVHAFGPDSEIRVRVLYFCGSREFLWPGEIRSRVDDDLYSYNIPMNTDELEATESSFQSVASLSPPFREKVLSAATKACNVAPQIDLEEDLVGIFISQSEYYFIKNSQFRVDGSIREFWVSSNSLRRALRSLNGQSVAPFDEDRSLDVYYIYKYSSFTSKWRVDCNSWTMRVLASVEYDKTGKVIQATEAGAEAKSFSIVPDTVGDSLAKTVCKIR